MNETKKSSGSAPTLVGLLLPWNEYIFKEKNTKLHIVLFVSRWKRQTVKLKKKSEYFNN